MQRSIHFDNCASDACAGGKPLMEPVRLLNEPDRHQVAIEIRVARLDRGDDDEDGVQDPKDGEEEAENVER